ncbi:MAG TPA: B12-binding domain-containing radical SAM protein [Cyanobacteria bacterium UBA8530]|nr:B12-binding domain-containing radical SAM protein [Cyanobacteria bacterium UBA8530]
MRILFVRPNMSAGRSSDAMEPLAFAILAGLTPSEIERKFLDERLEIIPLDEKADLLALSVETFTARRAYQIADAYRERGIPVVMGGFHPTFLPEEALEHADAVVIGDAEEVWPRLLEDLRLGELKKTYRSEKASPLDGIIFDRSIFQGKKYVPISPVQFGRGCKFACDFCSINAFYGSTLRQRPVKEVIEEIRSLKTRNIFFVDDNLFVDEAKTRELLESLIPLKVRWGCQISMDVASNPALLDLMKQSGCMVAQTGFESLNKDNLGAMGKKANLKHFDEGGYLAAIEALRKRGIMIYGTFVLGYDYDTPESFLPTVAFARKNKFFLANFNPLMTMPGTRLFKRLKEEGRLIHEQWWLAPDYRYGQAMFQPGGMTPEQLTAGCFLARRRFNAFSSLLARFFSSANLRQSFLFFLANLISRREILGKQGHRLGEN